MPHDPSVNHLILRTDFRSELKLITPQRTLRCFPGDLHVLSAENVHLLAVLLDAGAVSTTGHIKKQGHEYACMLTMIQNLPAIRLPEKTFTATDIRNLQSAKATAASSVQILMEKAGLTRQDICSCRITSPGGEIPLSDAKRIGLIPRNMGSGDYPAEPVAAEPETIDLSADAAAIHAYTEHLFFPGE